MTHDNEAIVRRAYHAAEGNVLDVAGFVGSFTDDGVIDDIVGQESYRGEQLGEVVLRMAKLLPDVHRELHRVTVLGDVAADRAIDPGHVPRAAGDARGDRLADGSEIAVPTADFWCLRDGGIETFNCYVGYSVMFPRDGRNARLRVGGR